MAPMNPDQYYRAHCGCMFFPCGGGVTQHSHTNLRQHHPGTNATSRALPSRPYDPANAPHNPLGRIDEDQGMNDSASSPPADGSYNMNTGEGPSSSNTTRNQAAYELRRRDSVMSMLADDLRRWPTDQETDDYSAEMRVQPLAIRPRQEADPLPDLFDINRTGIQRRQLIEEIDDEPAESTHELAPRSGTSRRRRHAEAFGIAEAEPPLHEAQRRIDTGSRPAQQGYPGDYQPPTVEDARGSPPMSYRHSIRRRTNQSPSANAGDPPRRGDEATLHHSDLSRGGTENQLPPTVRSGNARSRGGGPYSPGPRRRHGRRRYSPYQSSSSDDSRNSTGRPGNPLSQYLEDNDDDDDDGHHTY